MQAKPKLLLLLTVVATGTALAACGSSSGQTESRASATLRPAAATASADVAATVKGPKLKIAGSDYGRILFNGRGRALYLFTADTRKTSNCSGDCATAWPPYIVKAKPTAGESYLAISPGVRLPKSRCSFQRDDAYAIGDNPDRVVRITRRGAASDFAALPSPFLGAIAFDRVGSFGHRLLVAGRTKQETTLYAIDCRGRVKKITAGGPLIEGGMQVAPPSFGQLAGRLIAVDELSGRIYAFKPNGGAATVARPGLPTGGDIGVEALGFVPPLKPSGAAFLADHGVPGNPHPGTDSLLRLTASELKSAGVRAGDLLVATEGGAETISVRCRKGKGCAVRRIGAGPSVAHAEGHISFLGLRR